MGMLRPTFDHTRSHSPENLTYFRDSGITRQDLQSIPDSASGFFVAVAEPRTR